MVLREVNEAALSETERLALAACRLNTWEWDEIIGPKPEGFDDLPEYDNRRLKSVRRKIRTKRDYLIGPLHLIKMKIGEAEISRFYWVYVLGRTEEEWRRWWESGQAILF